MAEVNSAFLKLMALEEDGNLMHHLQQQQSLFSQEGLPVAAEADFDEEEENWSQSSVEHHFASVLLLE